jgi:hypothetical protein
MAKKWGAEKWLVTQAFRHFFALHLFALLVWCRPKAGPSHPRPSRSLFALVKNARNRKAKRRMI